jgi:NADH pyrophosphatase NudC (nudix superfamily)
MEIAMSNEVYISKQLLIDDLVYNKNFNPAIIKYSLDSIPKADVAPVVHGKWCWEGKFKACSECGSYVEWNETLGANFWKYCPYCGAKMDLKETQL